MTRPALPARPDLAAQFRRGADLLPERGQRCWWWTGGAAEPALCAGTTLVRRPAGGDLVTVGLLHQGRLVVVPADRVTAVPPIDAWPSPARP